MKRVLLIGVALLAIIGGVYLARQDENSVTPPTDTATTTASNTPVATTTEQNITPLPAEGEVTLGLGQTASFRGLLVTPVSVVEDSRCPASVQCIQAGTVRVKVEIKSALGVATKTMKVGDYVTTEAEKITFVSVAPEKRDTNEIPSSAYRFTVKVEKRTVSEVTPPTTKPAGACYVGGCSGQICSDEKDVVSTCEFREEYACYKTAKCERQPSGQCGWTPTAELTACLQNAS